MKAELRLRPATLDDSDRLLVWRNDPATRRSSRNSEAVIAEAHGAWLRAVLADPDRRLMIAESGGEPVGTVRADRDAGGWELSWTVAPAARGKGYGARIVAAAMEGLFGLIRAAIRPENGASLRIAEAVGMTMLRKDACMTYWELRK